MIVNLINPGRPHIPPLHINGKEVKTDSNIKFLGYTFQILYSKSSVMVSEDLPPGEEISTDARCFSS